MTSKNVKKRSGKRRSHSSAKRQMTFAAKIKELYQNPAIRYIAGTVAVAALAEFSKNFSKRYPHIINMIEDGLDSFENKLSGERDTFSIQH